MYKATSDLCTCVCVCGEKNSTHELSTTTTTTTAPQTKSFLLCIICRRGTSMGVVFIINAPVTQQRITAISLTISKRAQRQYRGSSSSSSNCVYMQVLHAVRLIAYIYRVFVVHNNITFCFPFSPPLSSLSLMCYIARTHTHTERENLI